MESLLPLVGFAFISSVTPGPNNILLWASGAAFGLRRTAAHIVGTAIGLGSMALLVAAGLGVLITTVPSLAMALKIGGSIYLLYLAYRIAGAHALERAEVARPLSLVEAALFQAINPKAWIFALGAVTAFRPATLSVVPGTLLIAATMMLVIVPSAAIWAAGGGILAKLIEGHRERRAVSLILAVALAATVVSVWL